ncbi:hypothetical protein CRUP_003745, partial [Coryphaenoides rupestris]
MAVNTRGAYTLTKGSEYPLESMAARDAGLAAAAAATTTAAVVLRTGGALETSGCVFITTPEWGAVVHLSGEPLSTVCCVAPLWSWSALASLLGWLGLERGSGSLRFLTDALYVGHAHLSALHAEHRRDPLRPERLPAQQALGARSSSRLYLYFLSEFLFTSCQFAAFCPAAVMNRLRRRYFCSPSSSSRGATETEQLIKRETELGQGNKTPPRLPAESCSLGYEIPTRLLARTTAAVQVAVDDVTRVSWNVGGLVLLHHAPDVLFDDVKVLEDLLEGEWQPPQSREPIALGPPGEVCSLGDQSLPDDLQPVQEHRQPPAKKQT